MNAVYHILCPKQVCALVGVAGAGKSTLLAEARLALEAAGYRVRGCALAGKAAAELFSSSGIGSTTIASLEHAWARSEKLLRTKDVLVVDEAGMIDTRMMARLVAAVNVAGAKLIVVGDPEQLQPIGAGAPFRLICERAGFAEVRDVRRQGEQWQRRATMKLSSQQTTSALLRYRAAGAVAMKVDTRQAIAAIADDYIADMSENTKGSRLIMAHRRADVQELNRAIRERLMQAGHLPNPGDTGSAPFQASVGKREFAIGDKVVFLRNDRHLNVKNGTRGTVYAAKHNQLEVRLDDEERQVTVNAFQYDAIEHGYAVTCHKAQGSTVDNAFMLASSTLNRHLSYVGLSRHRQSVKLYAGLDQFSDFDDMAKRLSRAGRKENVADYQRKRVKDALNDRIGGEFPYSITQTEEAKARATSIRILQAVDDILFAHDSRSWSKKVLEPLPSRKNALVQARLYLRRSAPTFLRLLEGFLAKNWHRSERYESHSALDRAKAVWFQLRDMFRNARSLAKTGHHKACEMEAPLLHMMPKSTL